MKKGHKQDHRFYLGLSSLGLSYNMGDPSSIPGLGRSLGEGNGNPLQYSCLENLLDGGAWLQRVGHD